MFKVNVSPDMGMYHLLRSQGYDPAYALAEFIDNALHAYQEKCKGRIRVGAPLHVDLKFYSSSYGDSTIRNCIVIADDGPGISRAQLPAALKPARHKEAKWLSEFGIGMKAAAVWFADTWELVTRPTGERKKFQLTFNLEDLLASGGDSLDVVEGALKKNEQGTEIILRNLRRPIDKTKYDEVCDALKELYQRFTAGTSPTMELTASLDGTPQSLKFSPPTRQVLSAPVHRAQGKQFYAIGPEKTWSVAISMVFNGIPIEGHICLLEKGSYTGNPGLVLFRHDRVICGTTKKPNTPKSMFGTSNKYAPQRVYGELHLDGLPVSYTKDKFEIDEAAFFDQLKRDPQVAQLIIQAESYRTKGDVIRIEKESDISGKVSKPSSSGEQPTSDAPPSPPEPGMQPPPLDPNVPPSQQPSSSQPLQPPPPPNATCSCDTTVAAPLNINRHAGYEARTQQNHAATPIDYVT